MPSRQDSSGPGDPRAPQPPVPAKDALDTLTASRKEALKPAAPLLQEANCQFGPSGGVVRITKDEMVAATGTPNETGARLDWTLQCYADLELKYYARGHELSTARSDAEALAGALEDIAGAEEFIPADVLRRVAENELRKFRSRHPKETP